MKRYIEYIVVSEADGVSERHTQWTLAAKKFREFGCPKALIGLDKERQPNIIYSQEKQSKDETNRKVQGEEGVQRPELQKETAKGN